MMEPLKIKGTSWKLDNFFSGIDDPKIAENRKEWDNATNEFVSKWKNRTDYLEDANVLREALDDFEDWEKNYGAEHDEIYYFWLLSQLDQNDSLLKAKFNKVEEFSKNVGNKVMFFLLNIAKIPKDKQEEFLKDEGLKKYKHFLNKLFLNAHYTLSENEEKIMDLESSGSYSFWVDLVQEALSKEEKKVFDEEEKEVMKSFSDLMSLVSSKNKKVRDTAAKTINEIVERHSDIAVAEINALLYDRKINDEIRGYDRPDKSRHVSDDIDSEIIDSLIDSVSKKFSISKKFYGLKSKLLGLDKLEYHERNIEYGDIDKKYTYEESVKLVNKVFSNLDSEFSDIFRKFVEGERIDVFPRKGKRDGAFCVHFLKTHPVYVMLNHSDRLRDVETLAHEMGHAINFELMKKQNALNFGMTLATGEVASTFMEDFVIQELMNNADDETRLALYMQKLNGDISSIIRQITCYKFELELHKSYREKGHLSKKDIGELFKKHMSAYMGDFVEQSPGSENWWVYWGHIRRYFYNYSYASGLLISKALQRRVKEDHSYIEKVKDFLSAGFSKSPKEIFLDMGLDISKKEFWNGGLKEVEDLFEETEALAKKLGKI